MATQDSKSIPSRVKNLTGKRYGRLKVHSFAFSDGASHWNCVCSCGNKLVVKGSGLQTGNTRSCGCLSRDVHSKLAKKNSTTHGKSKTKIYRTWASIKTRCYNPNTSQYKDYGRRGIKMCEQWRESFENFYGDMGDPPTKRHTVERIDNNGNYEPGNCRWATRKAQCRNKRNNRLVTHNGETKTLVEWSEKVGMDYDALRNRLDSEWDTADALNPTPRKNRPITYRGETRTIREWAKKTGMSYQTLRVRFNRGWTTKRALTQPLRGGP